ncbi:methyltransferase domain-containing protein [Mycobacterium sp.]|uniref:class I SAM-dependent methyltransferase n=1 Tax=Mycobacterium sp. TaxID=1785 RepID=UPI001209033A|nr:methyltransferase domain-containing protein [Mycobacterium sp.]TAM66388.1 MAG: methyltransferase domain-containing protein [Mycobacterium sp.]
MPGERVGSELPLPASRRDDEAVGGHWLLARLGKRVLRPGGLGLTRTLLSRAELTGADVVELAPGLGRTATEIVAHGPRSYLGAEGDPDAANIVRGVLTDLGAQNASVRLADAAETGLPDASSDVVIGEAMLTMQGDTAKHAIVAEATRVLRPGGRYAIHELALTPDTVSEEVSADIRQALARSIKVNARPLTIAEWSKLLTEHGLVVDHVTTAPMALLQPRRLVSDEGLVGALRFARNVIVQHDARKRVLAMRRTFRKHRQQLTAVAIVAHKPAATATG